MGGDAGEAVPWVPLVPFTIKHKRQLNTIASTITAPHPSAERPKRTGGCAAGDTIARLLRLVPGLTTGAALYLKQCSTAWTRLAAELRLRRQTNQ